MHKKTFLRAAIKGFVFGISKGIDSTGIIGKKSTNDVKIRTKNIDRAWRMTGIAMTKAMRRVK